MARVTEELYRPGSGELYCVALPCVALPCVALPSAALRIACCFDDKLPISCERSATLHSLHASYFGTEITGRMDDYRLDFSRSISEVDQQDSGSPRRRGFRLLADTTFETTVMNTLLVGGLADVWQVSSVGHLVALAGQACKEVSMAANAYPTQPDSRFTERLRSTQVSDLSTHCSCRQTCHQNSQTFAHYMRFVSADAQRQCHLVLSLK